MTPFPSPDYRPGLRWMPPTTGPIRHALVTARQADVLTGICLGLTNREIARALFVTEDTVKTHAKGLYQRLDARDRAQVAVLAISGEVVPILTNWSQP